MTGAADPRFEIRGPGHAQRVQIGEYAASVAATLDDWLRGDKLQRLWNRDASVWSGADEAGWLGWLDVVSSQRRHPNAFRRIAEDVRSAGFRHIMVLGMGGSSLGPEVLAKTFGSQAGSPQLRVLDSTVPSEIRAAGAAIDPAHTLFVVSSKSGGTAEPNAFKQHFFEIVRDAVGDAAGSNFIAITDPGSSLEKLATRDRFRAIFHGVPSIGGRYSALSNFGMIPAAAMGLDVASFLERTQRMVDACAPGSERGNPGLVLGVVLGTLARSGRDKVTIVVSPGIAGLGSWLEQLIAESTGKRGRGIVPITDELPGTPAVYGDDRLFVQVRLAPAPSPEQDAAVDALEKAGQPVVRIEIADRMDLGQEFFRWEFATAVAGSLLEVNPFDQPDVEASKVETRKLTAAYEQNGEISEPDAFLEADGLRFFANPANTRFLRSAAQGRGVEAVLGAHLARLESGDYFAVNAYIERNQANTDELQAIRHAVRDGMRVATTLGFGPRFLHSTGQLHKGGPNSGVFLQITSDDDEEIPIPGGRLGFGALKRAQAQGDFDVLADRDRRILRVHLGADLAAGLVQLRTGVRRALGKVLG